MASRILALLPVLLLSLGHRCSAEEGPAVTSCPAGDDSCVEDSALLQVAPQPMPKDFALPQLGQPTKYKGPNYCSGTGAEGAEWQSPIDISSTGTYQEAEEQPTFFARDGGCNTGHFTHNTQEFKCKFASGHAPTNCSKLSLMYKGKVYTMVQFFLRHSSEDTIDGKPTEIEITMPHLAADGTWVAVAVLVKQWNRRGSDNSFLNYIFQRGRMSMGWWSLTNRTVPGLFNPYEMLKPGGKFWTFQGSSTQPPCMPGVTWFVAQDELSLSGDFIRFYRDYLALAKVTYNDLEESESGKNNRAVQPLNGRTIQVGTFGPVIKDNEKIPPFPGWGRGWSDLVRGIHF